MLIIGLVLEYFSISFRVYKMLGDNVSVSLLHPVSCNWTGLFLFTFAVGIDTFSFPLG